jgi:hypothetical protein
VGEVIRGLRTRAGTLTLLRERFDQHCRSRVSGKRCGSSGKQCPKFPVSRAAKPGGETECAGNATGLSSNAKRLSTSLFFT